MMGGEIGFGIPGVGMILIWGLIVVAIVWLVRALTGDSTKEGKSARQILDERFASGEIDQGEYEQKKRMLG
ncbi:MAG: SHOCT domain-containing protein [Pseudomonadota bacterium]|nr:SHOCT domain-containing protein [Pseudomonadota bacterium]